MVTQLLCTFSKHETYLTEIESVCSYYNLVDKKVYVLQSGADPTDIFLTYNAEKSNGQFYPHTVSVHRKKEFNTIYSINALNELIKENNGGVLVRTYQIDWDHYRNCFITTREGKVKITPTKLLRIFRIK